MQDLTPNAIFLSSAFLPSREEVRAAVQRPVTPPPKKRERTIEADVDILALSDSSSSDSDDDVLDFATLMRSAKKGKDAAKENGKGKENKDEDGSDSDSSSDSDSMGRGAKAKGKAKGNGKAKSKVPSRTKAKASGKGKGKGQNKGKPSDDEKDPGEPDQHVLNTWKQGGSNVESSAKMLQMVAYLKEWESSGDKTIIFSQCASSFPALPARFRASACLCC